jgi:predicted outer membrane repeat protein
LRNITFINTQFSVKGAYNATNIIFKDSTAKSADRYSNSYGGAIYSKGSNEVYVDNCTFINNTAQYGGAIYAYNGILDVKDSIFIDNYAYNYGGAIACEYNSKVKIKNSTFTKSHSLNDAGGAVYLTGGTIRNCYIANNFAGKMVGNIASARLTTGVYASGSSIVDNCTILNNSFSIKLTLYL